MSERRVTRDRLRRLLGVLAQDWQRFSDYFYAYKHGGLAVHRPDVAGWMMMCPWCARRPRGAGGAKGPDSALRLEWRGPESNWDTTIFSQL